MRSSLKQTNKTNPTPPPPHNKIKPGLEKKQLKQRFSFTEENYVPIYDVADLF